MSQVISFESYTPIARYDAVPWSEVRIQESVSASGPWTLIDTQTISPLDADPSAPATRNFTTTMASDTLFLWYRLIFADAATDTEQPTAPVQNVAGDSGDAPGPCAPWVTGTDVAECCTATDSSADLDTPAGIASQILFTLTGGQYSGLCGPVTVRPSALGCRCDRRTCGCPPLSQVTLAGYPVREITEVKIDGAVVAPSGYRLDQHRFLTRMRDPANPEIPLLWPGCQKLDLDDDQPGTFSVSYTYGRDPTDAAKQAAVELACQIFQACQADAGGDCVLPSGVVSVTRAGITYSLAEFRVWGRDASTGAWRTGLPLVDMFLNTVNPTGRRRPPAIWSPDLPGFPKQVG